MNSDGNLFWFVNFIKIKDLVINKKLLQVINAYEYNNEKIKDLTFTEEYVERFKNHFQKERFYYTKYWLKYSVKRSENDTKIIIEYNSEQEKIVVRSTIIMILYLLECRTIRQENEKTQKKLQAFVDDYIIKLCRTLATRISMDSFDIITQFLLFLSVTNLVNPTKTDSIENLFIVKLLFKILNLVFIEDKEENNTKGINVIQHVIEYFLSTIIGESNEESQLRNINNRSNRFLLSHYYEYSHDIVTLSLVFKNFDIKEKETVVLKSKFSQLLGNIFHYSFNFHSVISPFAENMQKCFLNLNFDSFDIETKKREIEFTSVSLNTLKLLVETENLMQTGFYMRDGNNGITVSEVPLKKPFSLLFSFTFLPNKKQKEFPIFSISNTESLNCIIKQNDSLSYDSLSYDLFLNNQKVYEIQPYTMYKFGIIHCKENSFRLLDLKTNQTLSEDITIKFPDKKYILYFGYFGDNIFSGIIGSIVYTHLVKDDKENNKSIKDKYNFQYDNSINKKNEYNNAKSNILENGEWMLHPAMFQFIPFIDNFTEIPKENSIIKSLPFGPSNTLLKTHTRGCFHKNFYAFFSSCPIISFLDNDGLSFLLLVLEYYLQILIQLKKKETIGKELVSLM